MQEYVAHKCINFVLPSLLFSYLPLSSQHYALSMQAICGHGLLLFVIILIVVDNVYADFYRRGREAFLLVMCAFACLFAVQIATMASTDTERRNLTTKMHDDGKLYVPRTATHSSDNIKCQEEIQKKMGEITRNTNEWK